MRNTSARDVRASHAEAQQGLANTRAQHQFVQWELGFVEQELLLRRGDVDALPLAQPAFSEVPAPPLPPGPHPDDTPEVSPPQQADKVQAPTISLPADDDDIAADAEVAAHPGLEFLEERARAPDAVALVQAPDGQVGPSVPTIQTMAMSDTEFEKVLLKRLHLRPKNASKTMGYVRHQTWLGRLKALELVGNWWNTFDAKTLRKQIRDVCSNTGA